MNQSYRSQEYVFMKMKVEILLWLIKNTFVFLPDTLSDKQATN